MPRISPTSSSVRPACVRRRRRLRRDRATATASALMGFAARMLDGSRADADDVVQDAFIRALRFRCARPTTRWRCARVAVHDRAQPGHRPDPVGAAGRRTETEEKLAVVPGTGAAYWDPADRAVAREDFDAVVSGHRRAAAAPAARLGRPRAVRRLARRPRRLDGNDGLERQVAARPVASRRSPRPSPSVGCAMRGERRGGRAVRGAPS